MRDVFKRMLASCDTLGEKPFLGKALKDADPSFLDVREYNFHEHIAMQASAIAYFGARRKEAERHLEWLERGLKRWKKAKFIETKSALLEESTSKKAPTLDEINARLVMDNEAELKEKEAEIRLAQQMLDSAEVWYEALKQKSYMMREYANALTDEFLSISSTDVASPTRRRMKRERDDDDKETHADEHETLDGDKVAQFLEKRRARAKGKAVSKATEE
jgi:hypothetical protein